MEEITDIEKEYIKKEKLEKDIFNVMNNQDNFGKLKFVSKVRKSFICRECQKIFSVGSSCYNQSDYRGDDFFPVQTKICIDCGQIQINNGAEVKINSKQKILNEVSK